MGKQREEDCVLVVVVAAIPVCGPKRQVTELAVTL